jgi:hypothetical protein
MPSARGLLSENAISALWHVAHDIFPFALKRVSEKSFLPNCTANGFSSTLFDGSWGNGGIEPIHKDCRIESSSSVNIFSFSGWALIDSPQKKKINKNVGIIAVDNLITLDVWNFAT